MAEFVIKPSSDSVKSIAELRKEMKALKDEQAAAVQGSEGWTNAASRIGEIKDQLKAANEQAAIFTAGTSFEKSQKALSSLKDGITSLDFGKAAESAQALQLVVNNFSADEIAQQISDLSTTFTTLASTGASTVTKLTESFSALLPTTKENLKTLTSFSGLSGSFKTLTSGIASGFSALTKGVTTFGAAALKVGLQLLTNPIFLLATAITLIVVALVALLQKFGLLQPILEAVQVPLNLLKAAVDAIVQSFKNLTDWLGFTSFAAEESAEKQASASKKAADAQEKSANRVTQALDNEIRRIQATGDESDEAFEKILAAERAKRVELDKTAQARLKEAEAALASAQLKKGFDKKELEDLKEKLYVVQELAKQSAAELELGDLEADKKRRERQEKQKKKDDDDAKKKLEDAKRYARARLDAERQIEDLRISLIADDTERELAANAEKYKRLIEDTKKNETLLQKEKDALIKSFEALRVAEEAKIREAKKKADEEKAKEERNNAFKAQQNVDAAILEARKLGIKILDDDEKLKGAERISRSRQREAELIAIEKKAQMERLENLKQALDNKEITQEEYDAQFALETLKTQQAITDIEEAEAKKRIDIAKAEQEKKLKDTIKMYEGFIGALNSVRGEGNQLGVDLATNALTAIKGFTELANQEFETAAEKVAAYTQVISGAIAGILSAISESQRMKSEEDLKLLEDQSNSEQAELQRRYEQGLISREQYDASLLNMQKTQDAKALAIKKKAFEADKKMRIVEATMSGISGAIMAFVGPFSNPALVASGVAPILGTAMAALVGGMAAINIAKISSQKFDGGGGGGASLPSGGPSPESLVPATPTFMGSGNQANTATSTQARESQPQQITVTAIVSETDITSTQERVAKMNSNAEL